QSRQRRPAPRRRPPCRLRRHRRQQDRAQARHLSDRRDDRADRGVAVARAGQATHGRLAAPRPATHLGSERRGAGMSRPARVGTGYVALFATLYAVQGVVVAYFFNFNQIYMGTRGVASQVAASVQSVALVPFLLKFLAGPLSDRVNL